MHMCVYALFGVVELDVQYTHKNVLQVAGLNPKRMLLPGLSHIRI